MKRKHHPSKYKTVISTALLLFSLLLLMIQCSEFNPNGSDKSQVETGSVRISIDIGRIGVLAKTKAIELEDLILTLSSSGEDTIRDTVSLSGIGGCDMQVTIGDLSAPLQWRLVAATFDTEDSCIHAGSTTFITEPADTVDVSLDLDARFSMLRVSFNGIPDSVTTLSIAVDAGDFSSDSTIEAASTDTLVLSYDYLTASAEGDTHAISLKVQGVYYGIDTYLYSADTTLTVVSGEDGEYAVTLAWIGPYINQPPEFTTEASEMTDSVSGGSEYRDTVSVSDPDGDDFTLLFGDHPDGIAVDDDGVITWASELADTGNHPVELIARDGNGGHDTLVWTIGVVPPPVSNHAPVFTSVPSDMRSTVYVDSQYVDTVHVTDDDGDEISFSLVTDADGLTLDDSVLTWTPTEDDVETYSVSVIADDGEGGTDTLEWSIRVREYNIYPEIEYGVVLTGEIDPGVDVDIYQFTGTAGDIITLRVDPLGSAPDSRIQIVNPGGTVVADQSVSNASLNAIEEFELPSDGQYVIRVMEIQGNETFDYEIGLYSYQHSLSDGTEIEYAIPQAGSVSSRVMVNRYLFTGTEGDIINLRVDPEGSAPDSRIEIVDPSGTVVADQGVSNASLNAIEEFELPSDGQYVIRVMEIQGNETFDYEIGLYSYQHSLSNGIEIEYAIPQAGSVSSRVMVNRYLFTGTEGDIINLRVDPEGSAPDSRIEIVDPSGTVVADQGVSNASLNAIEEFELPSDGQYVIRVMELHGNETFDYEIGLYSYQHSLSNGIEIEYAIPQAGSVSSRVMVNRYLFTGTEGDIINLRVDPEGSAPDSRIEIVDPSGTVVADQGVSNASLNAIEEFELPSDGQYVIRVMEIQGNETFDYEIGLYSYQHSLSSATAIGFYEPQTGSITSRVMVNRYLFTGSAGDAVTLRVDPDGSSPDSRIQIVDPDGTVIANQAVANSALNAIEDFELPANGDYLISVMEAQGNEVFDYSINLIN